MLIINITTADRGRLFTASCNGLTYSHRHKDPIPPLCRRLIAAGHSPETLALVCRGSTLAFKPRSLGAWAAYDIVEDDTRGLIRRRYRPLPDFVTNYDNDAGVRMRPSSDRATT